MASLIAHILVDENRVGRRYMSITDGKTSRYIFQGGDVKFCEDIEVSKAYEDLKSTLATEPAATKDFYTDYEKEILAFLDDPSDAGWRAIKKSMADINAAR